MPVLLVTIEHSACLSIHLLPPIYHRDHHEPRGRLKILSKQEMKDLAYLTGTQTEIVTDPIRVRLLVPFGALCNSPV